jgi:hypothetical protein
MNIADILCTVFQGSTQEAVEFFEKSRKLGGVWYAPGSKYNTTFLCLLGSPS